MKLKWTTCIICLVLVVCGCVAHQLNKTKLMPPNPIKLQKSLEIAAHKRQYKTLQKIFTAAAPISTNIVLEWPTPTNIAGVPVVYQIMYDTSASMQSLKLVGETQTREYVDHIDPAVPNKFYMIQTLAAVTPNVVMLAWDPSPDPAVVGYNIYYGSQSRNYTNKLAVGLNTTWKITTLTQPGTYYFAVTSTTASPLSDVESDFSSEIVFVVAPVPPQKVPGLVVHR